MFHFPSATSARHGNDSVNIIGLIDYVDLSLESSSQSEATTRRWNLFLLARREAKKKKKEKKRKSPTVFLFFHVCASFTDVRILINGLYKYAAAAAAAR